MSLTSEVKLQEVVRHLGIYVGKALPLCGRPDVRLI